MMNQIKILLKSYLIQRGYEIQKRPKVLLDNPELNFRISLDLCSKILLSQESQIFLIQVGAYDGVSNDPVRSLIEKYPVHAILVEPQQKAFEKLIDNYSTSNTNVHLENVAVSEQDGLRDFYFLKGDNLPDWYSQLASFSKENILAHNKFVAEELEDFLFSEKVKCKTISTLLDEYSFPRLDILQIDAEGYDEQIVRSINFEEVSPKIICYEHCHMKHDTRNSVMKYLARFGYQFCINDPDTIACKI